MVFKNSRIYDVLKWAALICLPAVTVFLNTVLPVWGVDAGVVSAVVTTASAVGTLLGALLCVSNVQYKATMDSLKGFEGMPNGLPVVKEGEEE